MTSVQKRRRNRKRYSPWPAIRAILIAAAVCATLYVLLTNKHLIARQVTVTGSQTVSAAQVASLVELPRHQNIFLFYLLHFRQIERRITKADPPVYQMSLGISLPSTITVHLQERQPYAVLHTENGSYWLIDHTLVPYRLVDIKEVTLPVISVLQQIQAPVLGKPLPVSVRPIVADASELLDTMHVQNGTLLPQTKIIIVDQYSNLSLILANHLKIKLGQPNGLMDKLNAVENTLNSRPDLTWDAVYLDFSSPRPAYMPKPPAKPVDGAASTGAGN